MSTTETPAPHVVNVADAEEHTHLDGDHWGGHYKVLTPHLDEAKVPGGRPRLGVNLTRLPPGRALCPFHWHQREDEVFYVLSGRGVLRYASGSDEPDDLREIGPGDCISCPAGNGRAHQIANPFAEDLVYLAIGPDDADEVCVYPDSEKVMVRSLKQVGLLEVTPYMHGEPAAPDIFALAEAAGLKSPT